MNLIDTRQLLTMLWGLYPNAPKLSSDERDVMAMAWLAILYEYSLEDVWQATKKCVAHEPRFVPTAPEILKHCEKTLHIDRYLPQEYQELCSSVDLSIGAEVERRQFIRICESFESIDDLDDDDRSAYLQAKKEQEIIKKIDSMWKESNERALADYNRCERQKLFQDGTDTRLKQLCII